MNTVRSSTPVDGSSSLFAKSLRTNVRWLPVSKRRRTRTRSALPHAHTVAVCSKTDDVKLPLAKAVVTGSSCGAATCRFMLPKGAGGTGTRVRPRPHVAENRQVASRTMASPKPRGKAAAACEVSWLAASEATTLPSKSSSLFFSRQLSLAILGSVIWCFAEWTRSQL